jgi:DNA-binding transcriptional LysR family regulator
MRREELSGRLAFGAPTDYAPTLLQKLLPIFSREFPKVTPNIVLEPSRVLRNRIQSGTMDMAIVAREAGTEEGFHLWSEEITWYGKASDDQGTVKVGLLSTNCILRDRALEILRATQQPHRVVLEAASVASLYDAVEAGFCQAFLPTSVANSTLRSAELNSSGPVMLDFALIVGGRFETKDAKDLTHRFKRVLDT